MIIDLDAHQGNGHERDFIRDTDAYILDCYNPHIYPGDRYAKNVLYPWAAPLSSLGNQEIATC